MANRPARPNANPQRQALLVALAVLALQLLIWWRITQWYGDRLILDQRAEAAGEVSTRGSALSSGVNRRLARLQALHAYALTEGSDPAFATKFEQFASDLYAGSRGLRNLAIAPGGKVQHVYPLQGNEAVLGYDPMLDSRPEVVADVRRAVDTGLVILSGPLELVQGGLGLIARQAVYQNGQYWGLVNVVVDVDPILSEAGLETGTDTLEYALRDSRGEVFFGSSSVFSASPIITYVTLPEGYWELAYSPRDGWPALIWQPLLITMLGALVSISLLTSLVYLTVNRQIRLAAAVEQRTKELSAANSQLEQRVEERTGELTMLLNISRSIASTLDLEALLVQVLHRLLPVLDYTSGAILTLEDDEFTVSAYHGPSLQKLSVGRRYSANNSFGRQLIGDQTPILIPDLSADTPLVQAFRQATSLRPEHTAYLRSWMGIPLIAREKVIGMLALQHKEPGKYTQESCGLALAFANQVAVAIENARLHESAQRLAVLQERQRLARELHDSVLQALYGIALGTRTARAILDQTPLDDKPKAAMGEPLDYILSLSEGGLAEMRALIFELRPESLESEGLTGALAKQAAALQARHQIAVTMDLCQDEPETPLQAKEAIYRVAQEALRNVAKHSRAAKVLVRLERTDGQLQLEVSDDGQGFEPDGGFPGHLGLLSMRERVEQLQGTLTITSSVGRGTQILATVPAGRK